MLTAWWTNGGEDAWHETDIGAASVSMVNLNDLWDLYRIEMETGYQRSYHYGGSHDLLNGGYFYLLNTANDETTIAADTIATAGKPMIPDPDSEGEVQEFNGQASRYLLPMTNGDTANFGVSLTAIFSSTPAGDISNWGPFHLYHYQPWAWYGSPAEVAASMLLRLGVYVGWLDTDSFDDAYDSETGLSAFSPRVYVSREVGRPVVELLKEVVRHSASGLFYNMAGQIAMCGANDPTYATLDSGSGIISLSHRWTDEHLCNKVRITFGQVCRVTMDDRDAGPTVVGGGDEAANSDYVSRAAWESSGQSQYSDTWVHEYENTTSTAAYGEYPLGGVRVEVDEAGNTTTVPATHFRFYGDLPSVQGRIGTLAIDGTMLRELTVVQDFRGLDYDVGYVVAGVQLTSDGSTIPFMRCIRKEIDFNNKTVTSVFLETDV